ncbi:DNA-binding response regulator [Rathayibacter sp. AY1C4]|uniref:response regulator transcription factor n=1 Tax=Rathayibacter sp. AY1C4 TaxID=2080537 RepID=UPI000CE8D881|nr:response regulator transcription factor [Rathayibacter sp. AY1C4]PPH20572.1 DNA-binding response regulator [Rathayibacter sp. AY1C4]
MTSVGGVPELRLAVVDDQPLYRHMLSSLLRAVPGVRSVVEAGSATEARSVLRPAELDVAILDIELGDGDGIELGRRLRSTAPGLGIVLLSAPALLASVRATADGRTVLDPALVAARAARRDSPVAALSQRQYEVLSGLASGLTNAAIGERLGIAVRSVDNHVNAVYASLGVRSDGERNPRVDATLLFLEHTG